MRNFPCIRIEIGRESIYVVALLKSHIDWGGERNFFIRVWKSPAKQKHFKNLEGKAKRENSKRTIFASGELGLL